MTSRARRQNLRAKLLARQNGIALVLALWLTVLLTVIASGFAFSMRSEALAARNAISSVQAQLAADGAVERTLFELSRPRMTDTWLADGTRRTWSEDGVQYDVTAVDESSKIDLNYANDALLRSLMTQVGGLDEQAAARLVDCIVDWRDPDDLKRPNGAEADDYHAAGFKYGPSNAPFETVGELALVMGMTSDVYRRVAGSLTVYSRQPGINVATAARNVLLALPAVSPEIVDDYLEQRRQALENKLPPPPFAAAAGFGTGPVPVWRIHAEARLPDGVTFVREAVVRPANDVRRPLVALAWTEGAPMPPPPPPSAAPAQSGFSSFLKR